MDRSTHDLIADERSAAFPDAEQIKEFRQYYKGNQRGTHTPAQAKMLAGVIGHTFADNLCRLVVNTAAGRHQLTEFEVEDEAVAEFIDALWTKNHLPALQQDVALAVLRDGNHALALRWRPTPALGLGRGAGLVLAPSQTATLGGQVTLHQERWWDGEQGIFVAYGGDGRPTYAVKDWREVTPRGETLDRRVIWFPDRIERWVARAGGWQPFALPSDPEGTTGIVPWVRRDGSPLGIPVVHFPNGSVDDSPYGASELAGGSLGMQDEINDIHRDITATARLTGYQMYTATGSAPDTDTAGNPLPLNVGPGQVLQSADPQTQYGVLPAGDLSQLKGALMTKIEAICRMTATPLHVITGDWPSGAALLRADSPLVGKVTRLNHTLAGPWATVPHRASEMANTFGAGPPLDENALITAVFADPAQLDALTLAETALKQAQALVEREKLQDAESLRELGLTDEQITDILGTREKAAKAAADRQAALLGAVTGPAPNGREDEVPNGRAALVATP